MNQKDFINRYMSHLNEQQRQAVLSEAGSLLVLAVPGSGKTTTIVTRLGYMILVQGVRPSSILTITFTRAATVDMSNRFKSTFAEEVRKAFGDELPRFQTINALSRSIIANYAKWKARDSFEQIEENDRFTLVRDILKEMDGGFPTDSDVEDLSLQITLIKNLMFSDDDIKEYFKPEGEDVLAKYNAYQSALLENRKMDFDDQMVYARRILLKHGDIRERYQKWFRYICVDEAQDTSKIQHEIIRILVGDGTKLLMVGDEDQSIYGFRGAYPDALLNFKKDYVGAKVLPIEYNYRSLPEIAQLADKFIVKNTFRAKKTIRPTRRSDGSEPVNLIPVSGRNAQYVPLMNLLSSGKLEGTTAILYRNNESSIPIVNFLDREGISYKIKQFNPSFFTHRVVTDICNTIRLAYNPNDRELFMDLYYKFGMKISKIEAASAVEKSIVEGRSPIEVLAEDVGQYKKGDVLNFNRCLKQITKDKASDAIDRIVNEMGYHEFLESRHMDSSKADILRLIGLTEDTAEDLLERLEELKLIISEEGEEQRCSGYDDLEESHIVLSTIHSSKGLEYDNVILVDAAEGILPKIAKKDAKTIDEKKEYEEERRLYYVALTRARNRLIIMAYLGQLSEFVKEQFAAELASTKTSNIPPSRDAIDPAALTVGARVEHRKFGIGTITDIKENKASIRFDTVGTKTLGVAFILEGKGIKIL